MKAKKILALLLAGVMLLSLAACGGEKAVETKSTEAPVTTAVPETTAVPTESAEITITDMIGREVTVTPGSYQKVVCIGAGA